MYWYMLYASCWPENFRYLVHDTCTLTTSFKHVYCKIDI